MTFYTGTGVIGEPNFKIERFEGFPVSKCGKYWGSTQEVADNAWKMDVPISRAERRKLNRNKQ